jgi:hypothetical protein
MQLSSHIFNYYRSLVTDLLHLFQKKRRRKIDRSMIGEPTNFMHLTHIGSGEMAEGLPPVCIRFWLL